MLPICAGPERSVAATKTFVASLAALLFLVADWAGDRRLAAAVERLPERLARAGDLDWSAAIDPIAAASSLVVIGRGPTLAIAREAALKLKEVANLHAEAFSGAEFLHGPVALVGARYPDPRADADRCRRRRHAGAGSRPRGKGRGGVRGCAATVRCRCSPRTIPKPTRSA